MKSPQDVFSPLISQGSTKLVSAIPSARIIKQYRQQLNLDVTEYFMGIPQVGVYECVETGFRFYYPPSMAGRDPFYRQLGLYPWFYQDDKWEHSIALQYVRPMQQVLDVGCGTGNFLHAAKRDMNATVAGIELNFEAAQTARARGLNVVGELIEQHAKTHREIYDIVCAFQVLEHIPLPGPFIAACIEVLKPGGLFVVGVPNNDAFLKFDPSAILNGPPHHMGIWTRKSLTALAHLFAIDVLCFEVEPLKEIGWYQAVMERRYLPGRWLRSLFHRTGGAKLFKRYIVENADSIAGHTILVVFRKRLEFSVSHPIAS